MLVLEIPIFPWMMTGGSPMTMKKPPNIETSIVSSAWNRQFACFSCCFGHVEGMWIPARSAKLHHVQELLEDLDLDPKDEISHDHPSLCGTIALKSVTLRNSHGLWKWCVFICFFFNFGGLRSVASELLWRSWVILKEKLKTTYQ